MPRTPLLRAINSLFFDAHVARREGVSLPSLPELRHETQEASASRTISRRALIAAVGTGAVALGMPKIVFAKRQPTIAIVGGGIAGLTCALSLADRGIASTVYEASGRIGGRMFSNTSYWNQGQVSEWCGELIDTGHVTIQSLARRFRIPLDNLKQAEPLGSEDTYLFNRRYYLQSQADSDFLAHVAARVADDANAAGYPTTYNSFTQAGAELDSMSIYQWIESRVPGGHRSVLGQLLDTAYTIEFGADTDQQSALNIVYLLGFQPDAVKLSIFGQSDETYHLRGGNQRLAAAIAETLGNIHYGHSLQRLAATSSGRYELTFDKPGTPFTVTADYVVLAIPFAVLRGLDTSRAGFDALKQRAIADLGRGHNGKTQLQFSSRLWNGRGAWHGVSTGLSFADTGYQSTWDATRAQPGSNGILVFYSGGHITDEMATTPAFGIVTQPGVQLDATTVLQRAEPVFPGLTARWNGRATQSLPHKSALFGASYSYWRVRQYLAFAGYEGVTQRGVLFCGEHTSQNFQGYMEGGASEGQRAAIELAAIVHG